METRVRDLEHLQLQEQDTEDRRRKRGTLALAAFAILALAFAIGIVVGKAVLPAAAERDPLDQLDRVAEAGRARGPTAAAPLAAAGPGAPASAEANRGDNAELTFERSLTEREERPEVSAALEVARREDERLAIHSAAGPHALGAAASKQRSAPAAAAADYAREPLDPRALPPRTAARRSAPESEDDGRVEVAASPTASPAGVPAGMTAGATRQQLEKAKQHDKLIAAALPHGQPGSHAAYGSDGEYTLQVISYDTRAAAESFASGLRARGHEAFVSAGEVEGRGRYYRVRLGPFKTRERAEDYRHAFEQRERMNTIVVKRAPPEGKGPG